MAQIPLMFQKRAIPGVNSDAFHFGYFEDMTTHERSTPKVHTKFDPLVETLCIFGGMIAVYILLTFICFGLREYIWSLKNRKVHSSGSNWSQHSQISIPGSAVIRTSGAYLDNDAMLINKICVDSKQQDNNYQLGTAYEDAETSLEMPLKLNTNLKDRLTVLKDSGTDKSFDSTDNIKDYIAVRKKPFKITKVDRQVYSVKQLLSLKPADYNGIPFIKNIKSDKYSVRDGLKTTFPFENVVFRDIRNVEKAIIDINRFIINDKLTYDEYGRQDKTTRTIIFYRLLVIGGNCSTFKNPNIFLLPFNNAMDSLIDTGAIFDILSFMNVYLQRSFIEMILQYCYAHWNSKEVEESHEISAFFDRNMSRPVIQPHYVLFRYLINLQLGFYTIAKMDDETFTNYEFRLKETLFYFGYDCEHNELEYLISIVSQAIEFSEKQHITIFLYEAIEMILSGHRECCMADLFKHMRKDFRKIFDTSIEGMTSGIKAEIGKIREFSINWEPELEKWWLELDKIVADSVARKMHSSTDKNSARKPIEAVIHRTIRDNKESIRDEIVTPGSWRSGFR